MPLTPTVLDRCCLRCWGGVCLLPGSVLLFSALSSLIESVARLTLTAHWSHPTGRQIAGLLPGGLQQWLADPHSWHGVHAMVARLVDLPLVVLLAVPGGLAVAVGLCLWDTARQQALEATEEGGPSPRLRLLPQLSNRRRLIHRKYSM